MTTDQILNNPDYPLFGWKFFFNEEPEDFTYVLILCKNRFSLIKHFTAMRRPNGDWYDHNDNAIEKKDDEVWYWQPIPHTPMISGSVF